MGSGPALNTTISPGGKGGQVASPGPIRLPGGKGQPRRPEYETRLEGYEAERRALDAQAARNVASMDAGYSSDYMRSFSPFRGTTSYQQPTYYQPPQQQFFTPPPQQFFAPPQQQFYSPPQQYFSPYMNQFQTAGSQFYQQPYSPQPYFQQGPFMQPGGRQQYFSQNMGGLMGILGSQQLPAQRSVPQPAMSRPIPDAIFSEGDGLYRSGDGRMLIKTPDGRYIEPHSTGMERTARPPNLSEEPIAANRPSPLGRKGGFF
jgi:hypothetical protein